MLPLAKSKSVQDAILSTLCHRISLGAVTSRPMLARTRANRTQTEQQTEPICRFAFVVIGESERASRLASRSSSACGERPYAHTPAWLVARARSDVPPGAINRRYSSSWTLFGRDSSLRRPLSKRQHRHEQPKIVPLPASQRPRRPRRPVLTNGLFVFSLVFSLNRFRRRDRFFAPVPSLVRLILMLSRPQKISRRRRQRSRCRPTIEIIGRDRFCSHR